VSERTVTPQRALLCKAAQQHNHTLHNQQAARQSKGSTSLVTTAYKEGCADVYSKQQQKVSATPPEACI
jgi:hypothetical protein